MLTKIEVTKMYWIGMSPEQLSLLKEVIVLFGKNVKYDELTYNQKLVISDLRQALINV